MVQHATVVEDLALLLNADVLNSRHIIKCKAPHVVQRKRITPLLAPWLC